MKVAILAAGSGQRLGPKTKYFPKALIKIGDKSSISHIIDYFPKDYEFVIVIKHLGDLIKQYIKIAHPDIKVSFIEQQDFKGPGDALLQCQEHLNEPFYIWCCDTLVKSIVFEKITDLEDQNWIGYAEADSKDKEYSSIKTSEDIIKSFNEKGDNYTGNAYVGCAFIKDYELFWQGMKEKPVISENQYQVSAGFNKLIESEKNYIISIKFKWFDIGNLEGLQKTKEHFKGKIENLDKEDEEIYFFEDKVVKYFYDEKISQNRVKRNLTLGDTVPKIISSEKNFYSYEYIDGVDLFSLEHPEDHVRPLFDFMKKNLWIEKQLSPEQCSQFHEACVDFYYRKTKKRIEQLFSKLHMYDSETIINGEKIPKIFDLLSVMNWKKLLEGVPTLIHGDFNFSNVLLTPEGKYKLIDIRQDFGGLTEFGDMYYDLAKFHSGLLFPHDVIKNNKYFISINGNEVNYKIESEVKYEESMIDFKIQTPLDYKKTCILSSLVLINMAPLHESPLNILLFNLGKEKLWKLLKQ